MANSADGIAHSHYLFHTMKKTEARILLAGFTAVVLCVCSIILIDDLLFDRGASPAMAYSSGHGQGSGAAPNEKAAETLADTPKVPFLEDRDLDESPFVTPSQSAVAESGSPSDVQSQDQSSPVPVSDWVENNDADTPVLQPLAMVDSTALPDLSEEQLTALRNLREDFVSAMAGVDQDPTSPEYFERWEAARAAIDERFFTEFGQDAYNEQSIEAFRQAEAGRDN